MTLASYNKIKLSTVVLSAVVISRYLVFDNLLIPILVLSFSYFGLFYLRKKVDTGIADERDFRAAGRAAWLALRLTSGIGVAVMLVLYVLGGANVTYRAIAMTLAMAVCVLMFIYSISFRYYSKRNPGDEK